MIALTFASRNIKNFFRDKTSVFFSVLSGLIIIGLYALFLRNVTFASSELPMSIFDVWIMAGVVGVTTFSASLGALEIRVNDNVFKHYKDFYSSPVKRRDIALGYILSAMAISFIISAITLVFAQIYVIMYGSSFFGIVAIIKMLFIIALGVFSASSIVVFIVTFIKTTNAFGIVSTIVGTLIGFISGAFFPMNILPVGAQYVIKFFPVSHTISLARGVLLEKNFASMPQEAVSKISEELGIVFKIGALEVTPILSIIYLLAIALIFFTLTTIRLNKKK